MLCYAAMRLVVWDVMLLFQSSLQTLYPECLIRDIAGLC